jgi:hypothetical protein
MVGSLEPTVVLLQVGSNDLCQLDKSVQDIEQKLIGLVLTLKYCYHTCSKTTVGSKLPTICKHLSLM